MVLRTPSFCAAALFALSGRTHAQQVPAAGDLDPYARRHTFIVFGEYSNDSSHIIRGAAPNRKLGAAGFAYERRLLRNRVFSLQHYSNHYTAPENPRRRQWLAAPRVGLRALTNFAGAASVH